MVNNAAGEELKGSDTFLTNRINSSRSFFSPPPHFDFYYMKNFFEKNKVPVAIIVAAFLIAASIWLSKRPAPRSGPFKARHI